MIVTYFNGEFLATTAAIYVYLLYVHLKILMASYF